MKASPYLTHMTSLHFKPVEARQSTDRFFLLLFPINLALWLGVAKYYTYPYPMINYLPRSAITWSTFGSSVIAAVIAVIFLAFISKEFRIKTSFLIMVFIAVITLVIVYLIYMQLSLLIYHTDFFATYRNLSVIVIDLVFIPLCMIWLVYHMTILIRIKDVDSALLSELINEPYRAILGSVSTLLFSTSIATLSAIIFIFNANVIREQPIYSRLFSELTCWEWLRLLAFIFGGTYVLNFIYNFGLMVMGDFFAHYFSTPGLEKRSNILQSIGRVLRYHLGTVCFMSTPILPSLCALIVALKSNQQLGKQSGFKITDFFSKICLIMDISDYAVMQTSIYGYRTLKSIKEMFDLQHSNSLTFLIGNAASFKITEVTTIFAVIAGAIVEMVMSHRISWGFMSYLGLITYFMHSIIWPILYLNLVSKLLVRPAMCTFLIYKMTNVRKSAALEESSHLKDSLKI